ncbi:uncharacterized protein LOC128962474 [Oppia nitens]|uniref:uncharacterized protein LOC128962474 n=1 Tax=Oppia nitens TaxID=1686743 RepID=UPI0023D9C51E|nr:uncharacterized protein LOC128962474 [Oppia nitens]
MSLKKLKIKIIVIYTLIMFALKVCHTLIDPTTAMCIDGELDTAVRTADGNTYIFMSKWFWKLNDRLDKVIGNASYISNHWQYLPNNIETSFYISSKTNPLNGNTFFIQNNIWFKFNNQTFKELGNTGNWSLFPKSHPLLAISQVKDSFVVFYFKHHSLFNPIGYYFDSPYIPEYKAIYSHSIPFNTYKAEALLSYDNGSYLLFIDDNRIGSHCLMKDSSGCTTYRQNSDLFECPDYTKNLFKKNRFVRFWYWSGLTLRQFAIIFSAILISLTLILIFFIFLVVMKCRQQFVIKFNSEDSNH